MLILAKKKKEFKLQERERENNNSSKNHHTKEALKLPSLVGCVHNILFQE